MKLETNLITWDFELLDTGDGQRLERWGRVILSRPDPQILWPKSLPNKEWEKSFQKEAKSILYETKYENESAILHSKSSENAVVFQKVEIKTEKDFEISLTLKSSQKLSGLVFGKQENGKQYEFLFNPANQFMIRSTELGKVIDIYKSIEPSKALVFDEWNTLTIRKVNQNYYFFINKTLVYQMNWKSFFGNNVGIFLPAFSEISLKELQIYSLSHSSNSQEYALPLLISEIKPSRNLETKDNRAPEIRILTPSVTRDLMITEIEKEIYIKGKATDENGIYMVSINGFEAKVAENGDFSLNLPLAIGKNSIEVKAIDIYKNEASYTFFIQREQIGTTSIPIKQNAISNLENLGKYHALIIAVADYQDNGITDLDKPIQDAEQLYQILNTNYTIEKENITFLKNPKRSEITKELDRLLELLTKEDNLLVFYAGHGYWDEKLKQGYWFPADAQHDNRGTWLANGDIKDYMKGIATQHTLLITDACFSGSIFKTRNAFSTMQAATTELYKLPSRKAMTSGAMKAVPDNSVFIEYLVKRLKENTDKYLSAEQLFISFKTAVINNSSNNQVPQFGIIGESGDEGGDFIFVKRGH